MLCTDIRKLCSIYGNYAQYTEDGAEASGSEYAAGGSSVIEEAGVGGQGGQGGPGGTKSPEARVRYVHSYYVLGECMALLASGSDPTA